MPVFELPVVVVGICALPQAPRKTLASKIQLIVTKRRRSVVMCAILLPELHPGICILHTHSEKRRPGPGISPLTLYTSVFYAPCKRGLLSCEKKPLWRRSRRQARGCMRIDVLQCNLSVEIHNAMNKAVLHGYKGIRAD